MLIKNEDCKTIKLSLKDFITRVTELNWHHTKEMQISDTHEFTTTGTFNYDENDYSNLITLAENRGFRSITSRLGDVFIIYIENISFIEGQLESFVIDEGLDIKDRLVLQNLIVSDEDGTRIPTFDLIEHLPSTFTDLGDFGKDSCFVEEDNDWELFDKNDHDTTDYIDKRFISTYGDDVVATVKKLAVSQQKWGGEDSGAHQALKLGLYKTYSGRFLCTRALLMRIAGKSTVQEAVVVNDEIGIRDFFGTSELANDLYYMAGMN